VSFTLTENIYSTGVTHDDHYILIVQAGDIKGGSITTVDLLFDLFGLVCYANKNKKFSCHTANSKPVQ